MPVWLMVILGVVTIVVGLVLVSVRADATYIGEWDVYGVCPCGFKARAPFGKLFHIHKQVCPDCGRPKEKWTLKTLRWNGPLQKWEKKQ